MNKSQLTRIALALGLVLLLALAAGVSAQSGGQARWAAHSGVTPNAIGRGDDHHIVAFSGSGQIAPGCLGSPAPYTRGDVLFYEPHGGAPCWLPWFSAVNSGLKANVDINALQDECSETDPFCDIYLSFLSRTTVPGVGAVEPQDVVLAEWVPGSLDSYNNWQLVFDGSDVGLTQASEKIDALYVFDPGEEPAELGCLELGLISTAGAYRVPDQWGGVIRGGGEDVLGFCISSAGWDTAGYWFLYHDGSAEGAPANALIGLTHEDGSKGFARFEFLTKGPFHVDTANGGASAVYNFFQGVYDGPTFSYPDQLGTTDKVDSFTIYHTE